MRYTAVRREHNELADRLVNEALDAAGSLSVRTILGRGAPRAARAAALPGRRLAVLAIRSSSRADWSGLHATDPATVFLAARARGVEAVGLERALYEERSVLRMIGMRRTLFVLPLDLAAVVKAACTESIAEPRRAGATRS